jgi:methyl-accepting chemotaxis protein
MLTDGVAQQLNASDETARYIKEMTSSQREIAEHVEVLATSAEESSSSVIQMTATNEQVAGNIVDLATSVRETVASIEEMAVLDQRGRQERRRALAHRRGTSSSMNEMDVSIDQVQSNANETARLSEEVAQDAERGAEAILKTSAKFTASKRAARKRWP